jgi:hypothetical protein
LGQVGILLGRTMSMIFTARTDKGESWKMAHRFTNGSLMFILISMSFVGMIMVYQSTEQMARSIGDTSLVGASFLKILVRVLGPTVIGLLIACRVGAGIAAEIGAMAVTEQLDAMRMCAAEPIEALMVSRVRGGIAAGLILTVIGSAASILAGLLTGMIWFSISPNSYWNLDMIATSEVSVSITTDSDCDITPVLRELEGFADVTTEGEKAIVCLVGDGIRTSTGTVATIFSTLHDAGVTTRVISMGATKINVSFLLDEKDVETSVRALHAVFFEFSN